MTRSFSARALGLVLACSVAAMPGCSDLLEPQIYGDLTSETFFSSEADFNNAVAALYNPFMTNWGTEDQGAGSWYNALYNHHITTYWARSIITTDEMHSPWDNTFTGFTWGPNNFNNSPTYFKIRYVARATDVIDKISTSEADVAEEVKARYLAEAKALRGWLLFIIYDFYGPVNAKLDPETLSSTEITPRPSEAEYVAAIEADLLAALPDLADRHNQDPSNWGRVSQGSVRMVLLRLYMSQKDWAKAEAVARDITQMGYSLQPSYADVCNVAMNNELIYAVPADASSPNWYWQEITPSDFASAGNLIRDPGWYGFWMPWAFYDSYAPNDARLETILASYTNNQGVLRDRTNGVPGAVPLKCTQGVGGPSGSEADWPVFRYAETLLSLAEAINEQRGPAEAFEHVNAVRSRAGLDGWSGLSQEALRDSLLLERGRELYAEGVRRQDLIRHGKFVEYAQERGVPAQDHHVRFPIPFDVIEQGEGIVEQNPGY